ncbi:potassium channel family protein [Micromonospora echinofusca]|uniref:Two pore domain potassium channel family protein n=1 Tax=Micromonospora echinofusca TaxID=47858 RepID=A0ABS3VYA2_MICEH|nr:potassium channel family protein [Micromonospora echinofusca]MBO4209483.1 two pore domain potassium channel family protein [Micromonospora echinofusca]
MDALLLPFRKIYRGMVWFANSPRTLILSYLLMIVVSGVIYGQVENRSAGDAVWWAVVTASTVGYGDISPTTWQGRALAALLISTMVLLVIPLITAHFASKLIVDEDAFRHEEQEELKANLRAVRALLEELAARQGIAPSELASRIDAGPMIEVDPFTGAGNAARPAEPSTRPGRRRPRW